MCDTGKILPDGLANRGARCSKLMDVLGRSEDDAGIQESVNPLTAPPERTKAYTDVGDAVAGVLRAAEEAAEQIRADARTEAAAIVERAHEDATARIQELTRAAERARTDADDYANDIRGAVEGYGSQQRREAEEEARAIVAEAEAQARATREAAEDMGKQIEGDARRRNDQLRDEVRSLEERRQRVLDGLREMRAQLNELFPELAPAGRTETELLDALDVEHGR
jgi:chromosome segregation ATPase